MPYAARSPFHRPPAHPGTPGTGLPHALSRYVLHGGRETLYGLHPPGDGRSDTILRHGPVPMDREEEDGTVTVRARVPHPPHANGP